MNQLVSESPEIQWFQSSFKLPKTKDTKFVRLENALKLPQITDRKIKK